MISCFRDCTGLTEVAGIPGSVEALNECFSGCTRLQRVRLYCNNLDENNSALPLREAFKSCIALVPGGIRVPSAYYNNYIDADALNTMAVPGATVEEKRAKFAEQ